MVRQLLAEMNHDVKSTLDYVEEHMPVGNDRLRARLEPYIFRLDYSP
jgi:hypothetical protein